jgi:hypothetical protein
VVPLETSVHQCLVRAAKPLNQNMSLSLQCNNSRRLNQMLIILTSAAVMKNNRMTGTNKCNKSNNLPHQSIRTSQHIHNSAGAICLIWTISQVNSNNNSRQCLIRSPLPIKFHKLLHSKVLTFYLEMIMQRKILRVNHLRNKMTSFQMIYSPIIRRYFSLLLVPQLTLWTVLVISTLLNLLISPSNNNRMSSPPNPLSSHNRRGLKK